jgi:hypothetical protein
MRSASLRRLTGIWVAFLIAGITSGTVRAEMLWYVYAPGIGYVGKAGTTGWDNGILHAYGIGGSMSTPLYYVYVETRIWHCYMGTCQIQDRKWNSCFSCTHVSTNEVASGVYDRKAGTRTVLQGLMSVPPAEYYTSLPDYSASCASYYWYGRSC